MARENNKTDRLRAGPESVAERILREVKDGTKVLSPLGKKLISARMRIERSGVPLLTAEEVLRERLERRGGA